MDNEIYWAYNLPLQVRPRYEDEDDEESPVVGLDVLNYMPRKQRCVMLDIEECIGEQTHKEFFETAALILENLARQFREAIREARPFIYYPGNGMESV